MDSRNDNLLRQTVLLISVFMAQFSYFESSVSAASDLPLLTVADVRVLSRTEMAELGEIRIRGWVTLVNKNWNLMFVYRGGQSVRVGISPDHQVAIGTFVETRGQAVLGEVGPVIVATDVQDLSDTAPEGESGTAPLIIDGTTSFTANLVDQWVEFEGQAYSAVADDRHHYVSLTGGRFGVYAIIPNSAELLPLKSLRTARLRIRGIPGISLQPGSEGQVDLLIPDSSFVEVVTAVDESIGLKLRTIGEIGRVEIQDEQEAPARIRAVVRCVHPSGRIFISDETGELMVESHPEISISQFAVGDVVEVEGRIVRNLKHEYITDAMIRYIGKGFSQHPAQTTASSALRRPAALIELDGTLVLGSGGTNGFLMKSDTHSFLVLADDALSKELSRWGTGSRLRFTGCTWISERPNNDFELYPNSVSVISGLAANGSTEDITTRTSTASSITAAPGESSAPATDELPVRPLPPSFLIPPVRFGLQVALAVLLVTIVSLIYRRLKAQERFHKSIHEQLSHLSHIARLNTLAEMVGALAHELNQPLASVTNYAATAEILSKKDPADPNKLAGILTNIGQEAFRAGEIIRRLRLLVRKKTPGSLPVEIPEIIHETIELFKTQNVTASGLVEVQIADNLPTVQADSVQIQQVILNLLLNARDATEAQPDRTPFIQISASTSVTDGMVDVSVSDNGIGITSTTPEAIFEPYFTTREKGTGLGLAISRTIIETHGGKITAEKVSPHGTRITFSLPITRTPAAIK